MSNFIRIGKHIINLNHVVRAVVLVNTVTLFYDVVEFSLQDGLCDSELTKQIFEGEEAYQLRSFFHENLLSDLDLLEE